MPVIVLARIRAKAGCERQLERVLRAMIAKAEEKVSAAGSRYTLYQSSEDPALLILWERGDADRAFASEGDAGELIEKLAGLIDGRPIVETLTELVEG